jgi:glycine hydroxymethyltransferase
VVFGSTHKTFPGPQGGIIFSNRDDVMDRVAEAVYPGLVTNHHAFRIPALAIALAEMRAWGAAYADRIVANGQALGEALNAQGVPTVQVDGRHTASHTLLLRVARFGSADECATRLERCGIITTAASLPDALGGHGVRIGTQEVTRLGAGPDVMAEIAGLIAASLAAARTPDAIAAEVTALALGLGPVRFTWPDA